MKFSLSWLKELVHINDNPESLAEKLSFAGLEVESIQTLGEKIKSITTGKIVSITKHPNADKLVITQVDDGNTHHQIVTGGVKLLPQPQVSIKASSIFWLTDVR